MLNKIFFIGQMVRHPSLLVPSSPDHDPGTNFCVNYSSLYPEIASKNIKKSVRDSQIKSPSTPALNSELPNSADDIPKLWETIKLGKVWRDQKFQTIQAVIDYVCDKNIVDSKNITIETGGGIQDPFTITRGNFHIVGSEYDGDSAIKIATLIKGTIKLSNCVCTLDRLIIHQDCNATVTATDSVLNIENCALFSTNSPTLMNLNNVKLDIWKSELSVYSYKPHHREDIKIINCNEHCHIKISYNIYNINLTDCLDSTIIIHYMENESKIKLDKSNTITLSQDVFIWDDKKRHVDTKSVYNKYPIFVQRSIKNIMDTENYEKVDFNDPVHVYMTNLTN